LSMKSNRAGQNAEVQFAMPAQVDIPDEVAPIVQPSSLTIGIVSTLLVFAAFASLFLSGDDVFKSLRAASGKLRTLNFESESLIISIGLLSVLAIAVAAVLFERAKSVFLFFLLTSFAVSDVLISGVSEASLIIRYLFIVILITVAICSLSSVQKRGLDLIQWLGLIYLAWQLVGLLINGYGTTSLLLLPVQFAIFAGILIGLSNDYIRKIDQLQFCRVLGWIGIALTAFHTTALIFSHQPFLAGRFKSYYLLPTNFANGYALFVIAILWLALYGQRKVVRVVAWTTLPIGLGLLVLSGTRNSILIVFVAVAVFAVILTRRILVLGTLGAIATVAILVLFAVNTSQLDGVFDRFSKLEASTRQDVWALAWQYIMQRPLLGYGIGNGGDVLGKTLQLWERAEFINTHNAYLGIWLQNGLIGLILVGMIIIVGLIKGARMLLSRHFVLPVALLTGLTAGGMFEEYLTSRGSIQQLLWGFSLLMIVTASRSDSFTRAQRENSKD
jgi:O-antigen ligase